MSKISIIVAASTNMVIGKNGVLPWDLPSDMKFFKEKTEGHFVIMSSRCWESIPEKFRPLPNRDNIVITRNPDYEAKGAAVINDLEMILNIFKNDGENSEIFIIGGSEIYKKAFDFANKLYLTQVLADVEGDVFLEGFDSTDWMLSETSPEMEENGFKFIFKIFERIQK